MSAPRRALIVVDVQQEYFDGPLAIQYPPREESVANILAVMDAAVDAGIPTAVIEHESPEGFPVFAPGTAGRELHPDVASRAHDGWKRATKSVGSVFPETGLSDWLKEQGVDTVTLVGYMANNCILASAADAETRGVAVEVLSDATGAINLTNAQGDVPAQQVHETIMTLLNSNFASVADTATWLATVKAGEALEGSNLVASALGA